MTTETRLTEIEERLKAATPGPWHISGSCAVIQTSHITRDVWLICTCKKNPENDSDFIAHSPEDISFLLDLVRKQQAAVEEMRKSLEFYRNESNWIKHPLEPCSDIIADTGTRSRETLAKIKELLET